MNRTRIPGLVVACALAIAACSTGGGTPSVASLESGSEAPSLDAGAEGSDSIADSEEAMLAFTQCLRDQGIDVDDPSVDADGNLQLPNIEFMTESDGTDAEQQMSEFNDLIAPCEEHLSGVVMTGSSLEVTKFEDAFLEYAQCMRADGVDMPDPDLPAGGGVVDLGAVGLDSESFAAADEQCREVLARLGIPQIDG